MPEREPTIPPVEATETREVDVRTEYQELLQLQQDFKRANEEAAVSRDLSRTRELKAELETRLAALEGRVNPLERELGVKDQDERQKQLLIATGVVHELPGGEYGITDIEGNERPMPSLAHIRAELRHHKEILGDKEKQGFKKLLLVPIGMPLNDLINVYEATLWQHYQAKTLFATMRAPGDTPRFPDDLPFDANTIAAIKSGAKKYEEVWTKRGDVFANDNSALDVWSEYKGADKAGTLVYFPKQFDADPAKHQGKTKKELLAQPNQPFPGWRVLLVEDLPNIPRQGQGGALAKGGRTPLEANKKGREYLALLTDPKPDNPYRHEEGFTPEDWLMLAITHLQETNQVIDDWQGNGSVAFLTGAYFETSDGVPDAYWFRGYRQAYLDRSGPEYQAGDTAARSAVRV